MSKTTFDEATIKNNFAVAQVALCLFAILQAAVAPMTATEAVPFGIAPQASTMRRVLTITNAVVNILCFTVGYALLAQGLSVCTTMVWRIASSISLINTGVAALATAAQSNLYAILMYGVAIAGTTSAWNGRELG